MSNIIQFEDKTGIPKMEVDECIDYVWTCPCGSQQFKLYLSGDVECLECTECINVLCYEDTDE